MSRPPGSAATGGPTGGSLFPTTGFPTTGAHEDPFTAGGLAQLTWFLRERVREAHAAGHPHAQRLKNGIEDAVRGILDYIEQAASAPDPRAVLPARVRAHAMWTALQTAAAFWHDHPGHPGRHAPASAPGDRDRYTTAR
jgi:hypothetical protein